MPEKYWLLSDDMLLDAGFTRRSDGELIPPENIPYIYKVLVRDQKIKIDKYDSSLIVHDLPIRKRRIKKNDKIVLLTIII